MSPFKMLKNSGSSSRLVARRSFPNLVSLSLSGRRFPSASRLSVIVRNLYIVKIFSCSPGRSCLKKIGLPSLLRTRIHSTRRSGLSTTRIVSDSRISSSRFIYFAYIFFSYFSNTLRIREIISSISSGVFLISLGRQKPRLKISSETLLPSLT